MVRTLQFHCRSWGSIPGGVTEITKLSGKKKQNKTQNLKCFASWDTDAFTPLMIRPLPRAKAIIVSCLVCFFFFNLDEIYS